MQQLNKKDWNALLLPLFKKYGTRKHPLHYENLYQLVVMIVLSAQTTDALVNSLAPALFKQFPSFRMLAKASPEELYPFIKSVRGFRKKAQWLVEIAKRIKEETSLPLTIEALTELPGIGRKTANVILREAGAPAQGIFIDLHVARVVPRLGITPETNPEKMEKILLSLLQQKYWHQAGMALSYLGREICRPTQPQCTECLLQSSCEWYTLQKRKS